YIAAVRKVRHEQPGDETLTGCAMRNHGLKGSGRHRTAEELRHQRSRRRRNRERKQLVILRPHHHAGDELRGITRSDLERTREVLARASGAEKRAEWRPIGQRKGSLL